MTKWGKRAAAILVIFLLLMVIWVLLHQIWVDENCTQVFGTTVCK